MTKTKLGQMSRTAALAAFLATILGCSSMSTQFIVVHDLMSGFPSAPSGTASFYLPSTLTAIPIYGDASGTATTNPVTLDSNGAATIYLSQLARMIVQTNGGVTVSDTVINAQADLAVASSSAGFTATTLQGIGNAALAAFGGVDFGYVPSGAWVGMTPKAWMNSVQRNVLAYGTVGATTVNDGVTPADSAVAAAIADVSSAGGGIVYFPPGTYLMNSLIAVSHAGVTLMGAGVGATTIKCNQTNINTINVTGSTFAIRGIYLTTASASSGISLNIAGSTGVIIDAVKIDGSAKGVFLSNANNISILGNSNISGSTNGVSGTTVIQMTVLGGVISFLDTSGGAGFTSLSMLGAQVTGLTVDSSSVGIAAIGCVIVTLTFSGGAQPTSFYQYGCGIEGQVIAVASGATVGTIDLAKGNDISINANSGGAGTVTVPAITNPPPASRRGYVITIRFLNALGSGNAVTWALNAQFKLVGGAAPAATDAHTVIIQFLWDGVTSKFRELSRADITT